MERIVTFLLLGCFASQCWAKYLVQVTPDFTDEGPNLYDDIRLAPEQKRMKEERGFYTPGKWPLVDGKVTVLYYFNSDIPEGDVVRTNFAAAVAIYTNETCIRWVQTTSTDTRHKVKVFRGSGCYAYVGMINRVDNELSLGTGCEGISTIIHEMGHNMGLFHTQSRPDRDKYVRVWPLNIQTGMQYNFDIGQGDSYGVPYDYKSMMHYGNQFFSKNGLWTLTTTNPYAMFAIGSRPNGFRYSDSALLNKAYTCDVLNAAKCPGVTCLNGGFVTQTCTCRCPENTSGTRCETVTGSFFSDVPKCGRTITTEGVITPNGYPQASTTDKCIFKIVAPTCKAPSITFSAAKFYWTSCSGNLLSVEVSSRSFGYTFCDASKVPIGSPIVSETNEAALYYYTFASGFPDLGFRATVTFVNIPSCVAPTTTRPTTTTTRPTTTTTRPTTTTTRPTTTTTRPTTTTTRPTTTTTRPTTTTTRPTTTTTRPTTTTTRPTTTTTRPTTTTTRPTTTTTRPTTTTTKPTTTTTRPTTTTTRPTCQCP